MPSATRTIAIDRSPEDVFAFFSDPANDQRWRGHVKEIAADGSPGVGRHVHQVVEGPGGRGIAADIEVTAYDPPRHYAFQVVAGPARPRGEFTVTPTGTGSSVTFALAADLGGWKKFVMSGPVQSSMDGEMASLDRAKAILEGQNATDTSA